ncbi:MAG: M23 family metallopeptidase [Verrucomicrobia bacterium]|nr:M23 family metallopeptidase [Verrucomicrobiota bacterium]
MRSPWLLTPALALGLGLLPLLPTARPPAPAVRAESAPRHGSLGLRAEGGRCALCAGGGGSLAADFLARRRTAARGALPQAYTPVFYAADVATKKYEFYPMAGNFWEDLFPTNLVDLDPSAGIVDYHGTGYTYDGHRGIDTSIPTFAHMALGAPVYAALDGVVTEVHDGEDDMSVTNTDKPFNYVFIEHGEEQATFYLHFKRNSISVSVGQQVRAGQQIALTGSSGNSSGPHLHFQSYVGDRLFDPFSGPQRPGLTNWLRQPAFREDFFIREFVITTDDLTNWRGTPFDTSRTGSFEVGRRAVNFWILFRNFPANTNSRTRYLRPDGSVALDSGPTFESGPFYRAALSPYNFEVELNVPGDWQIEYSLNDQVVARAPFRVRAVGAPPELRPPHPVAIELDPPQPDAAQVLFCRVRAPRVFVDPDYRIVRFRYVWQVNGAVVRDTTHMGLADALPHSSGQPGQQVSCTVTPLNEVATGAPVTLSATLATPVPARMINVSTRARVGQGDDVLIGGLVVGGSANKRVLFRALGPSLGGFGVAGALADPTLEVRAADGRLLAFSDSWRSEAAAVNAAGLAPANDAEPAVVVDLAPGSYTAIVRGAGGTEGVAIVEAYELDRTAAPRFVNLSTRARVGNGDNVLIGGLVVEGPRARKVLLRAIGPSLAGFGVSGALAQPELELYDAGGQSIASSAGWAQEARAGLIGASELAPSDPREGAILARLPPGAYTAIVRGRAGATGVALVEAYELSGD